MDTSDIGTSDIEWIPMQTFAQKASESDKNEDLATLVPSRRASFRRITHDKLFLALLEGLSIESAASKAGCSTRTAHNILRNEEFAAELKKARSEMLSHAEGILLAR